MVNNSPFWGLTCRETFQLLSYTGFNNPIMSSPNVLPCPCKINLPYFLQNVLNFLVGDFRLTICLRVVACGNFVSYIILRQQFFCDVINEVRSFIPYKGSWCPRTREDALFQNFTDSSHIILHTGDGSNPLWGIVYDQQNVNMAARLWKGIKSIPQTSKSFISKIGCWAISLRWKMFLVLYH